VATALALSGCGGGTDEPAAPAPAAPTQAATAAPTDAPSSATPPPAASGGASPAINSLTVDPGDGTLMIGSGPALYRLSPGAREAERITGKLSTPQGEGTVSGTLILRFTGPGHLLASGHPEGGSLPENLGLIRSRDHGDTWEAFAGLGEADYHELEIAGKLLVGVNADSPDIQVSSDGGRTWASRTPPAPPIDVVVNPGDAQQWAVSTEQGTFSSGNSGGSWRPRDTTFGARLAWPANDALYSVDRNGKVRVSPDGGRSWKDRGEVGVGPSDVVAGRAGELYAAVIGGKVRRSRDGGASWTTVTTLR
jgi:photosystem II stability/assembly factor-like uncharacterized protein